MRTTARMVTAVAAVAILAGTVKSQTCSGNLYYSTGPMQFDAGVGVGKNVKSVGGAFRAGIDNGPYAGVGVARMTEGGFTGSDPTGNAISGVLGYQANLRGKSAMQVCPVASFERRKLEFGSAQLHRSQADVGASFGFVVPTHSDVHLVPFAGLSWARRTGSFETATNNQPLTSENYTPGTFGVGVHFGDRWMMKGQMMVPFGLTSADPVYGVSASFPIGRSR